ncbi:MAG: hypothetical protein ACE5OS_15360, partial [Anaerolineae bacterium]
TLLRLSSDVFWTDYERVSDIVKLLRLGSEARASVGRVATREAWRRIETTRAHWRRLLGFDTRLRRYSTGAG